MIGVKYRSSPSPTEITTMSDRRQSAPSDPESRLAHGFRRRRPARTLRLASRRASSMAGRWPARRGAPRARAAPAGADPRRGARSRPHHPRAARGAAIRLHLQRVQDLRTEHRDVAGTPCAGICKARLANGITTRQPSEGTVRTGSTVNVVTEQIAIRRAGPGEDNTGRNRTFQIGLVAAPDAGAKWDLPLRPRARRERTQSGIQPALSIVLGQACAVADGLAQPHMVQKPMRLSRHPRPTCNWSSQWRAQEVAFVIPVAKVAPLTKNVNTLSMSVRAKSSDDPIPSQV